MKIEAKIGVFALINQGSLELSEAGKSKEECVSRLFTGRVVHRESSSSGYNERTLFSVI